MELREAEGYADLGMWQEAWDSLDEVPPAERATPAVMRIRIRCCAPLEAWGIGEEIAYLMGQSPQPAASSVTVSPSATPTILPVMVSTGLALSDWELKTPSAGGAGAVGSPAGGGAFSTGACAARGVDTASAPVDESFVDEFRPAIHPMKRARRYGPSANS